MVMLKKNKPHPIKKNISAAFAGILLFVFLSGGVLPVQAGRNLQSECTSWDLAADFRASPDQENPNWDSCL